LRAASASDAVAAAAQPLLHAVETIVRRREADDL
jgi:hypothetical protein